MKPIITTAERFRRHQRDLRAYRQRHLFRRSHARFRRDLAVLPHLFLEPGKIRVARLLQSRREVVDRLREQVVWTLDTASRLACGIGILTAQDLTGYADFSVWETAVREQWIEPPQSVRIDLDPPFERPPVLVLHQDEPIGTWTLPSGERVVSWLDLMRDLKGTLGWRPDLLTRIEEAFLAAEQSAEQSSPDLLSEDRVRA